MIPVASRWLGLGLAALLGCRGHAGQVVESPSAPVHSASAPFAIVVDAGSTGSRVQVYHWDDEWPRAVLVLDEVPALDGFVQAPTEAGRVVGEAVRTAVERAGTQPSAVQVFVWATGGMRALLREQAQPILDAVDHSLRADGFASVRVEIIAGTQEAGFALHAATALAARSHDPSLGESAALGIVEVGGASAQIAYAKHEASEPSWGLEATMEALGDEADFPACFLRGDPGVAGGPGTGDPAACEALVTAHIDRSSPVPAGHTWLALSNFYYAAEFFALGAQASPSAYLQAGHRHCILDWPAMQAEHPDVSTKYLSRYCFAAIYLGVLLTRGFGLATDATLLPRHEIDGQPISWTLGALLRTREP